MQGNVSLLFNFIPKTRHRARTSTVPKFQFMARGCGCWVCCPSYPRRVIYGGYHYSDSRYVVGLCRCLVRMRRRLQCACEGEVVLGNAGTILIFSIFVANVVLSIQSGTAHANCANQTSLVVRSWSTIEKCPSIFESLYPRFPRWDPTPSGLQD